MIIHSRFYGSNPLPRIVILCQGSLAGTHNACYYPVTDVFWAWQCPTCCSNMIDFTPTLCLVPCPICLGAVVNTDEVVVAFFFVFRAHQVAIVLSGPTRHAGSTSWYHQLEISRGGIYIVRLHCVTSEFFIIYLNWSQ